MLISVDHGNKQIKTTHQTFTSGLCESDTRPPFGRDVLFYNGKYYTLSDQRIPYMRDKTTDERFFILTLFAIGFELRRTLLSEDPVKVQLSFVKPRWSLTSESGYRRSKPLCRLRCRTIP